MTSGSGPAKRVDAAPHWQYLGHSYARREDMRRG
jgi:hypothetical protein